MESLPLQVSLSSIEISKWGLSGILIYQIALVGIGLRVNGESNVIIRNLKISKVLADTGDAIGIQDSNNVWVDHCELFSDMDHDKVRN